MESSETIRAHAIDFFLENGADPTAEMQEVIVLADGCYSGRRFFCAELQLAHNKKCIAHALLCQCGR